jgi:hypothetical protein
MGGERPASGPAPAPVIVEVHRGWGLAEIAAIAFLTVGAVFLPIIGPLIGLVFVWGSSQWTTRQKWIATAIVVVLLLLPVLFLLGVNVGSGSGSVQGPY